MLTKLVECRNCCLHINQLPLVDKTSKAGIMWVGLSAKKVNNIDCDIPLSTNTNSGKIIDRIETGLSQFNFYKTNLVKCVPLNEQGKLRYPNTQEMQLCFGNLLYEIDTLKPRIVFLLGKDVATFVLKNAGIKLTQSDAEYEYRLFEVNKTCFVPIHHPSFITIYRRKSIDTYIKSVINIISSVYVPIYT